MESEKARMRNKKKTNKTKQNQMKRKLILMEWQKKRQNHSNKLKQIHELIKNKLNTSKRYH